MSNQTNNDISRTSNFDTAHKFVSKWEGGYVNHSSDPGGATNYGISLRFLRNLEHALADIDQNGKIDANDIMTLTKKEADIIYRKCFWDNQKLFELNQALATAHYDASVNLGIKQASLILQRKLNEILNETGVSVTVDGIVGKKTRATINHLDNTQLSLLSHGIIAVRADFYDDLILKKPSLKAFKAGWLNRLLDLQRYISNI